MMRSKILNPTRITKLLDNTLCKSNNREPTHQLVKSLVFLLVDCKEQAMVQPKLERTSEEETNKLLLLMLHPKLEASILEASISRSKTTQFQKDSTSKCQARKTKNLRFKSQDLEEVDLQISKEIVTQTHLDVSHQSVMELAALILTRLLLFNKNSFKRLKMLFLKSNRKFKMSKMEGKLPSLWVSQPWEGLTLEVLEGPLKMMDPNFPQLLVTNQLLNSPLLFKEVVSFRMSKFKSTLLVEVDQIMDPQSKLQRISMLNSITMEHLVNNTKTRCSIKFVL